MSNRPGDDSNEENSSEDKPKLTDRLKIGRSFVKDLPADRGSAAIARAIIQMAMSLGLRTVAEGVETEAQRAWALAQGCDEIQGALTALPMPADELEAWLRARRR